MADVIPESAITCPSCRQTVTEVMPTDACAFFWECPNCHQVASPKAGDCCVYCSYGTVKCPPIQAGNGCCG